MTPKFDKLVKSILFEMPNLKGDYIPDLIDSDPATLNDHLQEILEYNMLGKFNDLDVYFDQTKSSDFYYFIKDGNYIAHVYVSKSVRPFSTDSLWKNKLFSDVVSMTDIVLNFILPRYPYIQSSHYHTNEARDFWIRTIKQALLNNYKCSIFNYEDKSEKLIPDTKIFENVIDNIWPDQNLHPRIYRK